MAKQNEKEDFNVDEALDRLEEINEKLATDTMALDESIDLYKEGVTLADKAREHLEGVEQQLQIINK